MTQQLVLIDDTNPDYRMNEETRRLGRRGVAAARAALAAARRREPEHSQQNAA